MNATTQNRKLAHVSDNFSIDIDGGKSNQEILTAIKEAGYVLGSKSLSALMSGEKSKVGVFEMIDVNAVLGIKPEVAPIVTADVKPKSAGKKKLTPEQAELAKTVEKEIPTKELKPSRVLKDFSHLLATEPQPLLRNSVMAQLFEDLCAPNGATKEDLMAKFGWSAGGFGGIIHWEPKKRGYALFSQKVDGKLHYHLHFKGTSQKVLPTELIYRDKKPAPAPKAPKEAKPAAEPKAAKPPKEAKPVAETKAPKVKVTKEQMSNVPDMGGARVTSRKSTKATAV
jgi:hypothetical protein